MKLSRLSTVAISTAMMALSGVLVVGAAQLLPTDNVNEKAEKNVVVSTEVLEKEVADIKAVEKDFVWAAEPEIIDESTENDLSDEAAIESEENIQEEAYEYSDKFMVNVSEFLNVRAAADENSEVIGKLYEGSGGTVIEKGEEWTKISSGNVEGYAATEYLLFGQEAEAKANEVGTLKVTVNEDSIRIRKGAGTDFGVWGLAAKDDIYTATKVEDGWAEINFEGEIGYISQDFISVEFVIGKAISIEEEQEQIRLEEERKKQAEEEQLKAEQEAEAEAKKVAAQSQFVETVQTSPYNISEEDVYMLACLVHAEAGYEPYEGKLAVANVVLNRLNGGYYGNTIKDVIYAKSQFSVVASGRFAQVMSQGPNEESIRAAKDAVSGINNVPDYASFRSCRVANYSNYNNYTIIGSQVFFN